MNLWELKTTPNNYFAEQALIACIMSDNDTLYDIAVTEEMFFDVRNREIYKTIITLKKEYTVVDTTLLYWSLKEELKVLVYDYALSEHYISRVKQYEQEVIEKYTQRQMIKYWNDIATLGFEYCNIDKIRNIASSILMEWWEKVKKLFLQVYQETIDWLWHRWDKIASFGYAQLDNLKWYIEWNLIVIGARPKVWKSTLAINLMKLLAYQNVKSCLYSLEMTQTEVSERFISMLSDKSWILLDHLEDKEKEEVARKCLSKLELIEKIDVIDDIFVFTKLYVSIRKKVSEWFKVIFIDYLQLIEWEGNTANDRISKITKSLKRIAQELSICIVLLSQLNREGADWKPQLQHLRDSWAIEQDANLVMLLSTDKELDDILCVDVAANRAWPTLFCELKYKKNIYTITD